MTMAFLACSSDPNIPRIELLPSTQEFQINNGLKGLDPAKIKMAFSPTDTPLPVLFEYLEGLSETKDQSLAQIHFSIDTDLELPPQGYNLKISDQSIDITAKDEAGLFYAFASLDQLIEDAKDQNAPLPALEINDFPELEFRPIQWDIKHHRETESYYYQLIDDLARQKINGVIVELEDKLKYERRPEVGSEDAFTIQQWIDFSDYAAARHISISPLVQGLGHASFILKHEKNKHLRDNPDSDWAFNPLDPETYELQFDLYLDAIKATPHGKYLHVGGDEVETSGRGSGKSKLELNLIWLNKVTQFAEEHGRIPIFWDDMPLKHAGVYGPMFDREISKGEVDAIWEKNESKLTEFIDQFPKNVIYMRWNYSSPETYGNLKTMDWFSKNGFRVMGATAGQTRWVLMPQMESNYDAIRSFALSSAEKNLGGLLLTLWDDDSPHFELYKRGIATFAEYAWAGDRRDKGEFKMAYRHRAFGHEVADSRFAFIDDLEKPVGLWKNVLLKEGEDRNRIAKDNDSSTNALIELPDPGEPGLWSEQHSDKLTNVKEMVQILDRVDSVRGLIASESNKNAYRLAVYQEVSNLTRQTFDILLALEKFDKAASPDERSDARDILRSLRADFDATRSQFEKVYSQTRKLNKPAGYILDQDHHVHLANQSRNLDWQFGPEMMLLDKLDESLRNIFPG